MFTGKDIVVVKTENGPVVGEYDRFYLEFATDQPSETFTKTFDGKDLPNVCVRPNGERKGVDVAVLMDEAIAAIAKEYPGTAEKPIDPMLTLLEAASYGLDLWRRGKIQANLRPSKPVDKETAIGRMVKNLMAANPKLTAEKARAKAEAALADD